MGKRKIPKTENAVFFSQVLESAGSAQVKMDSLGVSKARNNLTECMIEVLDGNVVRIANEKRPDQPAVLMISEEFLTEYVLQRAVEVPKTLGEALRSFPPSGLSLADLTVTNADSFENPLVVPELELPAMARAAARR